MAELSRRAWNAILGDLYVERAMTRLAGAWVMFWFETGLMVIWARWAFLSGLDGSLALCLFQAAFSVVMLWCALYWQRKIEGRRAMLRELRLLGSKGPFFTFQKGTFST